MWALIALVCVLYVVAHVNGGIQYQVPDSSSVHRLAFGSCNHAERMGLWATIEAMSPDKLVLLGDNVYTDRKQGLYKNIDFVFGSKFIPATEEDYSKQYALLASDTQWQSLVRSVGGLQGGEGNVRAIYDDHDYGHNNADRTLALKNAAQKHFWDFLQVPADSAVRRRGGVYNSKTFTVEVSDPAAQTRTQSEGQEQAEVCKEEEEEEGKSCSAPASASATRTLRYKVILLDGRTFKDPKPGTRAAREHATDEDRSRAFGDERGDFLGEQQWQWLAEELLDPAPLDLVLIGSGIQLITTDKVLEETWAEFPLARQRLLNMIHYARTAGGKPNIAMLSGDVHTAEVLQGYWKCENATAEPEPSSVDHLWEFTSSGLTHTFAKNSRLQERVRLANALDSNGTTVTAQPVFEVLPDVDLPSTELLAERLAARLGQWADLTLVDVQKGAEDMISFPDVVIDVEGGAALADGLLSALQEKWDYATDAGVPDEWLIDMQAALVTAGQFANSTTVEVVDTILQALHDLSSLDSDNVMAVADAVGDTLAALVDGSALDDISEFLETGNLLSDGATYGERTYGALHAAGGTVSGSTGVPGAVDIEYSRGRFYEYIYDVFVAVGPSQARQHRFKDHFEGLHYGLLDIGLRADSAAGADGALSSSEGSSRWEMTVTTMDQGNQAVIQRSILLQPLAVHPRAAHASVSDLQQRWDRQDGTTDRSCEFQPIHGHTPQWRLRLIKWSLFLLPICSIVVPVVMALCLVWLFVRSAVHTLWRHLFSDSDSDSGSNSDYDTSSLPPKLKREERTLETAKGAEVEAEVERETEAIQKAVSKKAKVQKKAKVSKRGATAATAVPPTDSSDSHYTETAVDSGEAEAVGRVRRSTRARRRGSSCSRR